MTEKIQYIPSRLKNAAVGGHIGGTEDIIDDALGKEQSQINQDTIQALNDRYTKSQTYNKTELDSMITTPDQQYVTLTASDGDTLADIFDGVTGAADTIYRVGSWDGEQYDTTKYAEYSFDGTNFVPLDVKEVGIDNEPTAGSENLVKSGGIVDKYGDYVENFEFVDVEIDRDGRILGGRKTDGTKFENVSFETNELDIAGTTTSSFENPEYVDCVTDKDGKVIEATKNNGNKVFFVDVECYGNIISKGRETEYIVSLDYGKLKDSNGLPDNSMDSELYNFMRSSLYADISMSNVEIIYPTGYTVNYYWYNKSFELISTNNSRPLNAKYLKLVVSIDGSTAISTPPTIKLIGTNINFIKNDGARKTKIPFTYKVGWTTCKLNESGDTIQDPIVETYDKATLMLPINYSPTGEPIRLALYCHESSEFGFSSENGLNSFPDQFQYILNEGYAIFDVCGVTKKGYDDYVGTNAQGGVQHCSDSMGTPIAIASYIAAYKYLMKNYNFKTDIVCWGKSIGGSMLGNLIYQPAMHIIVAGSLAGICDLLSEIMRNRRGVYKEFYADQFGMSTPRPDWDNASPQETNNYFIANADKVIGYNPIYNGTIGATPSVLLALSDECPISGDPYVVHSDEQEAYESLPKIFPVPYKIWIAEDDKNVRPQFSYYMAKMAKKSGSICALRILPPNTGQHNATDKGMIVDGEFQEPIKTNIKPQYSDTNVDMATTYVELVEWFRKFEN